MVEIVLCMHHLIKRSRQESNFFLGCAVQTSINNWAISLSFLLEKTTPEEPVDVGPGPSIFERVVFLPS